MDSPIHLWGQDCQIVQPYTFFILHLMFQISGIILGLPRRSLVRQLVLYFPVVHNHWGIRNLQVLNQGVILPHGLFLR